MKQTMEITIEYWTGLKVFLSRLIMIVVMVVIIIPKMDSFAFVDIDKETEVTYKPLIELGVISGYDDNTFRGEAYVTRAEFCKMVFVTLKGSGALSQEENQLLVAKETTQVFDDVIANDWFYPYTMALYEEGAINGVSNHQFMPMKEVSFIQGIKIILDVKGYQDRANDLGGFPKGYEIIGKEMALLEKGIDGSKFMTRKDVADLLIKVYSQDETSRLEVIDSQVSVENYRFDPMIISRERNNLDGRVVSLEEIKWIRWRFLDMMDHQIIAQRVKLDDAQGIDLKEIGEGIGFERLGTGTYKFIMEMKTSSGEHTLINRYISVRESSDRINEEAVVKEEQVALLDMKYLNISQSIGGEGGHKGTYAIDLMGEDSDGKDVLYAPFDGVVTKIYSENNEQNFVWLESESKIRLADGSYEFVTVLTGHDNDISDLYVGKKVKQGEPYYNEGDSGRAKSNHIHLEVGKGKTTSSGWSINEYDHWHIDHMMRPDEVFFIPVTTTIMETKDLTFLYEGER